MPFFLTRTSVEDLKTDAKVMGSCPYPNAGRKTGWQPEQWAEQRKIQTLQTGQSMMTSGQNAKYGIVTVPPLWEGGDRKEALHLAQCYDSALQLAAKRRCRSVAFSLLSGDCNGFPRELALDTAEKTICKFLMRHEMTVYLSVRDALVRNLPKPEIPELRISGGEKRLSTQALFQQAIRGKTGAEGPAHAPAGPESSQQAAGDFSAALEKYMAGRPEADLARRANLERQYLRKLCSGGCHPKKSTVLALCLSLELTLEEAEALLQKAGYAFSETDPMDRILGYFVSRGEYDISTVNRTLFLYEQPCIL